MMKMNCRCGHHVVSKILVVLAWVAAIMFWWMEWKNGTMGSSQTLFSNVVILSLLAFGTRFCRCCHGGDANMMTKDGMKCEGCDGKSDMHNHQ